jgi:hypothetical protein
MAVTGTFSATGQSPSYTPNVSTYPAVPKIGFNFTMQSASFVGAVQLERSMDNGVSWNLFTVNGIVLYKFTGAVSEIIGEEEQGVLWRANCTSFTSGSASYRFSP